MRLVPPLAAGEQPDDLSRAERFRESGATETISVTEETLEALLQIARAFSGDMPPELGIPGAVHAVIERIEDAGVDLSSAADEEQIRAVASHVLMALVRERRGD